MIKVIDLIEEIRSGYSKNIENVTLTKDRLIGYINSAILELSKNGFINFKDTIDIAITDDRDYFLGDTVKNVRELYKLDSETGQYTKVSFGTGYSDTDVVIRNNQHLWITNPTFGDQYRILVNTALQQVDSASFIDSVIRLHVEDNIVSQKQLKNTYDLLVFSKDVRYEPLHLITALQTDLSLFQASMNYLFYTLIESLSTKSIDIISTADKDIQAYKLSSLTFDGYKGFEIPQWLYNVIFFDISSSSVLLGIISSIGGSGNITNFTLQGSSGIKIEVKFKEVEDVSRYKLNYMWSDVTKHTVNYINSKYKRLIESSAKTEAEVAELSTLLEFAIIYNQVKQSVKYTQLQVKTEEVQVTLGAIRNYVDLPAVFKEFILLFVSNKVMLAFNSNSTEFSSIYYSAFKAELKDLELQGYLEYESEFDPVKDTWNKGFD